MKDESSNIKTSAPWTHILKNGEIIKVELQPKILYTTINFVDLL
jgi:hypothetical protein